MRLLLIIILCIFTATSNAKELIVATAANFYYPISKYAKLFQTKYKEHKIKIISNSSGSLYAQIIHGAKYDIYFSADKLRPINLYKENKSLEPVKYISGKLILWSDRVDMKQITSGHNLIKILLDDRTKKIVIPNPKLAPYGMAAMQYLAYLGIKTKLKHKIVYANNVNNALQQIKFGADIGFISLSQIEQIRNKANWKQEYFLANPKGYKEIEQYATIIKDSKNQKLATEFLNFVIKQKK